jgi:hypothetical protein
VSFVFLKVCPPKVEFKLGSYGIPCQNVIQTTKEARDADIKNKYIAQRCIAQRGVAKKLNPNREVGAETTSDIVVGCPGRKDMSIGSGTPF